MEIQNFIGGIAVSSDSQKSFIKRSPFTGEVLAQVTASHAMDVVKALQSAKKALPLWSETSRENRAQILFNLADYFEKNIEAIAFSEALNQGLPKKFVIDCSVLPAIQHLRKQGHELMEALPPDTLVQPTGIIGIVTSWCLSLMLIVERMAPALAAGNVCIVKIAEESPMTGQILAEALQFAEAPAGIVNLLQGDAEVAKVVAGHPSIRAITAAGSASMQEDLAKIAVPLNKKVQISGSAKNSTIVLAGTDFKTLMPEILRPFLLGQGQMCWNITRLYILEAMATEFLQELKNYLETLQPLMSPEGDQVWTPLISESALVLMNEKVQEGRREHGKIFWGGHRNGAAGFYYQPTVMIDLPNCSNLQQEELSGPLLIVTSVKYQHEAIKWANNTSLGHSAIVWGPQDKVLKVASQLECAYVSCNSWSSIQSSPIFGLKQSSFGNFDMVWSGKFFSDVKKLAGQYSRQSSDEN